MFVSTLMLVNILEVECATA